MWATTIIKLSRGNIAILFIGVYDDMITFIQFLLCEKVMIHNRHLCMKSMKSYKCFFFYFRKDNQISSRQQYSSETAGEGCEVLSRGVTLSQNM